MSACSFDRLLQFVNKQLNLDGQLEIYDHIDRCAICRDTVYQLSREFVYRPRPRRVKPSVLRYPIYALVRSRRAYR